MSDELDINYEEPAVLPDDRDEAQRRVEWHARMVRHYQGQLDQEVGAFKREIERLKLEIEQRTKTARSQIAWHEEPIRAFHQMCQDGDKDLRTMRFPHGTSKITVPKKPVIDLADDDSLGSEKVERCYAWLREHHPDKFKLPGIATIRSLVDVTEDMHVVDKTTGEVIDWLKAEVPPPTYKFTPEEGTPL